MNRYEKLDELRENFSDSALLWEILQGMSEEEFDGIYKHIKRMWGLNYEEEM